MKVQRRQFLKQSALGVGGLLLAGRAARGAESGGAAAAGKYDPYAKVSLGKSGLKVSRFCLGTGMRGGNRQSNHTRMGREKFEGLLKGAYDRGVRFFDLADLYGTHSYVMPALKGCPRDSFALVSKIWFGGGGIPDRERPSAEVVVQRFLKEIGTDYIDLVLLHCVTSGSWPAELRSYMDSLAKLKEKGVIRAHGVSCHSLEALKAVVSEPWVDSVHARINPFGMSMDGSPEMVAPMLEKIHAAGKGVVGMKIVGEGRLRNDPAKRQESIQYVLGLKTVDVLAVGCESLAEVDDLAAGVRKCGV
jgi:aryl-alcohol dehydrogenase-like predicted oxidoreductase